MSHLLAFIIGYFFGESDKNKEPKTREEVERENEFGLFLLVAFVPYAVYVVALPFFSGEPAFQTALHAAIIIYSCVLFIKIFLMLAKPLKRMGMAKKYELLQNDTVETETGKTLYRIKALIDIDGVVNAGELGGYIESEANLSHKGNCWVDDNAMVFDNAHVSGDAQVSGDAKVFGNSKVYGKAKITGKSQVFENAKIFGFTYIMENAQIYGNAKISEDAMVLASASIFGQAKVFGNSIIGGKSEIKDNVKIFGEARVTDNAQVFEDAKVSGFAEISDNAKIFGQCHLK